MLAPVLLAFWEADAAMYQAKEQGRFRAALFQGRSALYCAGAPDARV